MSASRAEDALPGVARDGRGTTPARATGHRARATSLTCARRAACARACRCPELGPVAQGHAGSAREQPVAVRVDERAHECGTRALDRSRKPRRPTRSAPPMSARASRRVRPLPGDGLMSPPREPGNDGSRTSAGRSRRSPTPKDRRGRSRRARLGRARSAAAGRRTRPPGARRRAPRTSPSSASASTAAGTTTASAAPAKSRRRARASAPAARSVATAPAARPRSAPAPGPAR